MLKQATKPVELSLKQRQQLCQYQNNQNKKN